MNEELTSAYKAEDLKLRLRRSKIGCILGATMTPSSAFLDYLVYPEFFATFLEIRLLVTLLILGLFALHYVEFGKKHVVYLTLLLTMLINGYIGILIFYADGSASPYYSGLNLVILAAGVLFPWRVRETLFLSLYTLVVFISACLLHGSAQGQVENLQLLFNNGFFIFMLGLISTTSSYFTSQARINDFNLRRELDLRNKELEEVDRMKTQFFANISHELRTPLTLILSPIQDLLQSPLGLDDKIASLLTTARDNSMRLLKLVNDILEVIKLEEGKSNLALVSIEVNAFLAGTVNSMIHMTEPRGIEFKKELADEPLVVFADTYALERIFLNLLSNAIKFTPEGGSITVRSQRKDDTVILEVEDTGIGISNQDLPLIFDRFHQADGSSTRKYQGTGLGLALVKDLTEKMHGDISATSEPGQGTTMRVVLPLGQEEFSDEEIQDMPKEGDILEVVHRSAEHRAALPIDTPYERQEATLPSGDNPVLLIVDDEPDMRQYLVTTLEDKYRVVQARNGKQGLELAKKFQPELMILDFMLPEMDGLEVCKLLKQDQQARFIKIMLLTARMDEETKITALENGADDFLTKPFSKVEVQSRLHNLLETARLEKNLKMQNEELAETLRALKDTQARLVQSEKLNSLGTLTAGLMHEINNPLNFTLTALQVAQRDPSIKDDEDMQELFSDIDEGMQRIRTIVSDLHTFAYPTEAEKQRPFLFSQALESAMRFTAHQHRQHMLKQDLCEQDEVQGSQSHIVQVLINLLSNALRAVEAVQDSRNGEIVVTSRVRDGRLHISVRDNGTGISEEIRSHIFDPFFTTQDVGDGIGLGLSICHTILENHGSSLSVESKEGEWTEFSFSLSLNNEYGD